MRNQRYKNTQPLFMDGREYTAAFKAQLVTDITVNSMSIAQAAKAHDVTYPTSKAWYMKAMAQPAIVAAKKAATKAKKSKRPTAKTKRLTATISKKAKQA